MSKEIELLKNIVKDIKNEEIEGQSFYSGKIGDKIIYLAQCGIGKVNSALSAYKLIKALNPDLVINSGVAGGAAAPIGSILIADKVAYHDVWCGPGTVYGQIQGLPLFLETDNKFLEASEKIDVPFKIYRGLICSGDKFISTKEEIDFIKSRFPDVKAVDMESASIGHTCYLTKTPFAIIRVVSDTPGEGENISQYENFWTEAPVKTFKTVATIIDSLK